MMHVRYGNVDALQYMHTILFSFTLLNRTLRVRVGATQALQVRKGSRESEACMQTMGDDLAIPTLTF